MIAVAGEAVDAPTTLALVEIHPAGVPQYRFYLSGTSAAAPESGQAALAVPADAAALHIGSLGLVMEPIAASLEQVLAGSLAGTIVMLDPNCRPAAIRSRQAYLDRMGRVLRRADVIKVSTEDLSYLLPGKTVGDAVAALLSAGCASVLVTDGPGTVRAFCGGTEILAEAPPVEVADTVGAGDALGGPFLPGGWATGSPGPTCGNRRRCAAPFRQPLRWRC